MATALRFIATDANRAQIPGGLPATASIEFEATLTVNALGTDRQIIVGTYSTNTADDGWVFLFVEPDGTISAYAGGGDAGITSTDTITVGQEFTVRWAITGMATDGNSTQGSGELFLNGVSQGNNAKVNSDAYASGYEFFIGGNGTIYDEPLDADLSVLTITADTYSYNYSAADSDTSNTGAQPVLVDTIAANDATGVNFPTDGSAWIVTSTTPALTVTQTELTPGGTISGSYSNYATVPTTLTVSDGTNTITIASPTINDNGDGTGTFSGTMPSLPSSGTASLIQFTNSATVELS